MNGKHQRLLDELIDITHEGASLSMAHSQCKGHAAIEICHLQIASAFTNLSSLAALLRMQAEEIEQLKIALMDK